MFCNAYNYIIYIYSLYYTFVLCSKDTTPYQMADEDDVFTSDHSVGMVGNSQFADDCTGGSTPTYAALDLRAMEKKETAKV